MKRCLDEGVLQAYLDGELSRESAAETAEHLAACERCAASLAEAEGEGAFLAAAFAPDESVTVPTEQLRARVSAAVARLEPLNETRAGKPGGWGLSALLAPLTSLFTLQPQRAAAFAGLLAVVVFAAVFFTIQKPAPEKSSGGRQVAGGGTTTTQTPPPNNNSDQRAENVTKSPAEANENQNDDRVEVAVNDHGINKVVVPAKYERERQQQRRKTANAAKAETVSPSEQALAGEKDYEQAIASLSRAISAGGDAVLKPQVRAEYERSVAVLDKAIEETRRVARRNPKDRDAVEYLMSAYQSKVELLTTVADQAQVAALGR
jgi:tetratricopeptide (TPR) repeat protein